MAHTEGEQNDEPTYNIKNTTTSMSLNTMNRLDCLKYISFAILCLAAITSSAHAGKTQSYTNQEFGFSIRYPAQWTVNPSSAPNARIRVVSPTTTGHAECTVIVKRYPHAVAAKQSDIDQIFTESPSPTELKEVLSQADNKIEILKASTGKLHSRPAHLARVKYNVGNVLGGQAYAFGRVVMTATPGLTWSLSCNGQGTTSAEAEQNFQFWEREIN